MTTQQTHDESVHGAGGLLAAHPVLAAAHRVVAHQRSPITRALSVMGCLTTVACDASWAGRGYRQFSQRAVGVQRFWGSARLVEQ